jgi:hypothetical protein
MVRFFSSILLVFSLVGCSPHPPEAPRSSFSIDDLNRLFPSAMNWYEQTEQRFGATGRQLTEAELQQAHRNIFRYPTSPNCVLRHSSWESAHARKAAGRWET